MEFNIKSHLAAAQDSMEKVLLHLEVELSKVRAGKASIGLLDGIHVDYYGVHTPLSQVANLSTPDAKTIMIKPWEKSILPIIDKAIHAANIGLTPQSDGEVIRLNLPALTEERRKQLVKTVHQFAEHSKVGIRNVRRDANELLKQMKKAKLEEDAEKDAEDQVQKLTNSYIEKVDKHIQAKEKEIMTV